MSIAKSAKAYNREAGPTVTVTASDAAVTAAYKRGLKEGTVAAYKRGLDRGANNAHAAAAEIIAARKSMSESRPKPTTGATTGAGIRALRTAPPRAASRAATTSARSASTARRRRSP